MLKFPPKTRTREFWVVLQPKRQKLPRWAAGVVGGSLGCSDGAPTWKMASVCWTMAIDLAGDSAIEGKGCRRAGPRRRRTYRGAS